MNQLLPIIAPAAAELPFIGFGTDAATRQAIAMAAAGCGWVAPDVREGGLEAAHALMASRPAPAFLLVDLAGSAAPLGAVNALADVCPAETRVIAVGTRNDVALYRGLKALGILDYLVKPLEPAMLQQAMADALAEAASPRPMAGAAARATTIAFMGARGGAGVSTLLAAVAARLAPTRRVIVYDHDLQAGTIALDLDGRPGDGVGPMLEAPERVDRALVEAALHPHPLGFSLLAAEEPADRLLAVKPEAVMALVKTLEEFADTILVDLPRRLDRSARSLLRTADRVVIVTPRTMAGLRDTRRLSAFVTGLRAGQRPIIVANRVGSGGADLGDALFTEGLGVAVDLAVPDQPLAAARAAGRATALGAGEATGSLAVALDRLARLVEPAYLPPPRPARWRRLATALRLVR